MTTVHMGFLSVAPLVGAWIEIEKEKVTGGKYKVAPLVGAWIEITPWKNK